MALGPALLQNLLPRSSYSFHAEISSYLLAAELDIP